MAAHGYQGAAAQAVGTGEREPHGRGFGGRVRVVGGDVGVVDVGGFYGRPEAQEDFGEHHPRQHAQPRQLVAGYEHPLVGVGGRGLAKGGKGENFVSYGLEVECKHGGCDFMWLVGPMWPMWLIGPMRFILILIGSCAGGGQGARWPDGAYAPGVRGGRLRLSPRGATPGRADGRRRGR